VAFYTLGLNSSVILEAIGFGNSADTYQNLYHICIGNLILSLAGLIPGYWLCFLFIDRWGRRPIQLMGFSVLTLLFTIMGEHYLPTFAAFSRLTDQSQALPSRAWLPLTPPIHNRRQRRTSSCSCSALQTCSRTSGRIPLRLSSPERFSPLAIALQPMEFPLPQASLAPSLRRSFSARSWTQLTIHKNSLITRKFHVRRALNRRI
jgi:hypothetical protein